MPLSSLASTTVLWALVAALVIGCRPASPDASTPPRPSPPATEPTGAERPSAQGATDAQGPDAQGPDAQGPDVDVRALERRIHRGVNAQRAEHGLPPLQWADSLRVLALVHSRDMDERSFFGHVNPSGGDANDRATALGLDCQRQLDEGQRIVGFGENLYAATRYESYREEYQNGRLVGRTYDWKTEAEMARETVTGWMNSPGHRANVLDARYAVEAIGIHVGDERFYVTQIFC